jgi:hypothetical protein
MLSAVADGLLSAAVYRTNQAAFARAHVPCLDFLDHMADI